MRGVSFAVFFCLLLLAASFLLQQPAGVGKVQAAVARISCSSPACIIAIDEAGSFGPGFSDKALRLADGSGDVRSVLALAAVRNSLEGLEAYQARIDAFVNEPFSGNRSADDNALAAAELARRASEAPWDVGAAARASEGKRWAEAHPSTSFVWLYLASSGKWDKPDLTGGERPAIRLANSYGGLISIWEMLAFPSGEQAAAAGEVEARIDGEPDGENLAEDTYALAYFYAARYPALILKPIAFDIAFIYSLPVALICAIPLIGLLTLRGNDKRARYQRDRAVNILLCGLLVPLLLLLMVNLFASVPTIPAAVLLVFFIPLITPIALYAIVSLHTQREYGAIAEMSRAVVLGRVKKMFWVALIGAIFTLLLMVALRYVYVLTAPLKGPIGEVIVPAIFITAILVLVPFFPRLFELASGSFEVRNEAVRRRLDALAAKFGYSTESIRVIPSTGASYTNAMQVGLFRGNVRIFVFENLLDPGKFTPRELEAVVAHELAHIERMHIVKTVVGYVSSYLLFLLLLSLPLLFVEKGQNRIVDLFVMAAPYLSLAGAFLVALWLRRRFEDEADAVAASMGYGKELLSALKKIYKANLMPEKRQRSLRLFASHDDLKGRMKKLFTASSRPPSGR